MIGASAGTSRGLTKFGDCRAAVAGERIKGPSSTTDCIVGAPLPIIYRMSASSIQFTFLLSMAVFAAASGASILSVKITSMHGIIVRGGLWGRFAAGSKTIEQSRKDSSANYPAVEIDLRSARLVL